MKKEVTAVKNRKQNLKQKRVLTQRKRKVKRIY